MTETPPPLQKGTLAFDFKKAAEQALREFPAETKGYLFIDGDQGGSIVAGNLPPQTWVDPHMVAERTHAFANLPGQTAPELLAFVQWLPRLDLGTMYYRRSTPERTPFHKSAEQASADAAIFDHELAHIVIAAAQSSPKTDTKELAQTQPNLVETIADAFANIRHYQRYGMDSERLYGSSTPNAIAFLGQADNWEHTTFWAVDRIRLDAKTADFTSLTPAQTAALAEDYARKYTPTRAEMEKIREDYAALIEELRKEPGTFYIDDLSDAVLKQRPGTFSFHLGIRALQAVFDEIPPKDQAEWNQIRETLEQRVATLGDAGKVMADFIHNGKDITTHKPPLPENPAPAVNGAAKLKSG